MLSSRCTCSITISKLFFFLTTLPIPLPVFGILNMSADVDACDCALRLYKYWKRTCTERDKKTPPPPPPPTHQKLTPGEKSLAAPENWTCFSTAPRLLVWRSTNWAILPRIFHDLKITCQGNSWSSNTHLVVTASTSVHELLLSNQ